MNTLNILENTLDYLSDKDNWCVNTLEKGNSRCLMGALNYESSGDAFGKTYLPAYRYVSNICWNDYRMKIYEVNNHIGHDAVIDVLQAAIRKYKEENGISIDIPEPSVSEPDQVWISL
jgi:hypothetical protein